MSNIEPNSNVRNAKRSDQHRVLGTSILSFENCFGFRVSKFGFQPKTGFTIIELLVVIALIIVLAGLVLSTIGYVQSKAARSRAETEIAAMSAALENYKSDNGIYPRGNADLSANKPYDTDKVDARTATTPSTYQSASLFLYKQLTGDTNANLQPPTGAKTYFQLKPQMIGGSRDASGNLAAVTYIRDPFGNSYGYSTAYQGDVDAGTNPPTHGYNPTFDLWSTGNSTNPAQWIKNW